MAPQHLTPKGSFNLDPEEAEATLTISMTRNIVCLLKVRNNGVKSLILMRKTKVKAVSGIILVDSSHSDASKLLITSEVW